MTSSIYGSLLTIGDADLLEFVNDTIEFLKGVKVPFLSKYHEAFGGQARGIIPIRDMVVDLV